MNTLHSYYYVGSVNKVQISSINLSTDSTPISSNLSITFTHSLHINSPSSFCY